MKAKQFIICILTFTISVPVFSQNYFQKLYNNEESIENTNLVQDGNFLFMTGNQGSESVAVSNLDLNGKVNWSRTYSSNSSISNGQIVVLNKNKFLIGSNNSLTDSSNIFISKFLDDGQLLWNYQIGKENSLSFKKALALGDSAILIVGSDSIDSSNTNVFVCMIDTSGVIKWSKSIGDYGIENAFSVTETHDSSFVIVGCTYSYDNAGDVMLLKINTSGQIIWTKSYDITINSYKDQIGYDVIENNKKQLVICGKSKNYEFSASNQAWGPIVLKMDSVGNVLFAKHYTINSGDCMALRIQQKSDNEYVFIGQMGASFALMTDIDSSGIAKWCYYYSESSTAKGLVLLDDGFMISGNRYNGIKDSLLLIKTDNFGNSNCSQGIPAGGASNSDVVPVINTRTFSSTDIISKEMAPITTSVIDLNAIIICETETSIKKIDDEISDIYPNPVNNFLYLDKVDGLQLYFLYDINGKLLLKGRGEKVDFQQYHPSIYYLKVITNNGIRNCKIIKE